MLRRANNENARPKNLKATLTFFILNKVLNQPQLKLNRAILALQRPADQNRPRQ